jgi:nucleotide-binding universal stress UspA family protein
MKKIAFLIDEIDNSKELIRFAALLGKDMNAKVHVLYIQNPVTYGTYGHVGMATPPDPVMFQKITDEIKEKIAGFIKEIEAEHTGISSIKFKSETADAVAILKEKVENKTYDLVMLQGQDEQGFGLQNSVIMDVVRNVPCPVYIIPPDASYQPLKKIIYATDYNEEDVTTLKNLLKLAKPFNPEIIALHISNNDEFEKKLKSEGFAKMLSEKTGYDKISVKLIADKDGEDAVESLVGEAEKAKANLIVVLKENRNFFERLFKRSFTAELVKETQLPILVFHKEK